jgi:transposase
MRRYGLRDDQWERIKDFLPGREGHVGGTASDNRLFVEAVLYRYRAGIPWRDLPERLGDWKATCRFAVNRGLPQFVWRSINLIGIIRALRSSGPALPYIARLIVFKRLI